MENGNLVTKVNFKIVKQYVYAMFGYSSSEPIENIKYSTEISRTYCVNKRGLMRFHLFK